MYLCLVCLVWSPDGGSSGGGRFLLLIPPGDWSAPPPVAVTAPLQQTGIQQVTGEEVIFPCGDRDLSTFWIVQKEKKIRTEPFLSCFSKDI